MAIKKLEEIKQVQVQRPERVKLAPEEALRRMQEFTDKRKEALIAAGRKNKN